MLPAVKLVNVTLALVIVFKLTITETADEVRQDLEGQYREYRRHSALV